MAIAVITSPGTNQPAYNQMVFDISSTSAGQTNFNFLCDVYNGTTLVSRLLFPKQPSVNTVKIDISPVMRNYVIYDIENVYTSFYAANTNSRSKWYVQFGEVYDVATVPTIFANLRRNPTSDYKYAFNSVFDFEEFTPTILDDYDVGVFGYLTEIPEQISVKLWQKLFFTILDKNRIAATLVFTIQGDAAPTTMTLAAGEYGFNIRAGWDALVATGMDLTGITSYIVKILDEDEAVIATKTILLDQTCSKFDTYRLHWLNNLGGWDALNFTKADYQNAAIDRKQFKKVLPLNYDVNDRLKTNYNTTIVDQITINSNWLSDDMAAWVEGLFTSPIVLLERTGDEADAGTMIPINITDSNFEVKKYLNGRQLNSVSLTFEYSYNRYRQSL